MVKMKYDTEYLEILDDFSYVYKRDVFRKGRCYYKFRLRCSECNQPFFERLSYPTTFCSKQCANKSRLVRSKISKSLKGHTINKKQKAILDKFRYKGGVTAKNLPLYNTYAKQLIPIEEVRKSNNLLEVRCSLCKKWFIPKRTLVDARSQFIKGHTTRESRFYCSVTCKFNCSIFKKKKYPNGFNPRKYRNNKPYTESELRVWSQEVLRRAANVCEICGKEAELAHHIVPKKVNPHEALDPENGIALCEICHYKHAHKNECSTIQLANLICKSD